MDAKLRIVTRLPATELWREDGFTIISRGRMLGIGEIAELLRAGRIQFVVADVGSSPRWIPLDKCYDFWKIEVQPHLAAPEDGVSLDDFSNGYCYFASEWTSQVGEVPIVVCEKHH